jgi:hypothetical protein
MFTIYSLWVRREKLPTQNLDVKTWRAGHFPVNRWKCSKNLKARSHIFGAHIYLHCSIPFLEMRIEGINQNAQISKLITYQMKIIKHDN